MPVIPKVSEEQTRAFSKCWDSGGIKIILDNTAIAFACDWANIALSSFVAQIAQDMAKKIEAKKAAGPPPAKMQGDITVAPEPKKSSIILTD